MALIIETKVIYDGTNEFETSYVNNKVMVNGVEASFTINGNGNIVIDVEPTIGDTLIFSGSNPYSPVNPIVTPESTLEGLKTVDGESSGLDADLFDGRDSSEYALKTDIPEGGGNTDDIKTNSIDNLDDTKVIIKTELRPDTDGVYYLGFPGKYWKGIYTNSITAKGLFVTTSTGIRCNYHKAYNGSNIYQYANLLPTDDTYDLGSTTKRWKDIYSVNAPISTSDVNLKTDILELNDLEVETIINNLRPVKYKMLNGTSGRNHTGFIAQEVETIFNDLNIDLGLLIKSPKYEYTINKDTEEEIATEIPNEYVYGLRYEEFISIQTKYIQIQNNKLNDVISRLEKLEK